MSLMDFPATILIKILSEGNPFKKILKKNDSPLSLLPRSDEKPIRIDFARGGGGLQG